MHQIARALLAICVAATVGYAQSGAQRSGQALAALPTVALPPEFDRVLRDYERAWHDRNAKRLASLLTADAIELANERAPLTGRASIENGFAQAGGPLVLRALAYGVADTVGYVIGAYAFQPGAPDVGKFVLALRREGGKVWRIAADIENSNAPRRRP
jgi:hypothetical protein